MPEGAALDALLYRTQTLKAELNGLGDVPLDASVWLQKEPAKPVNRWLRYPMATAASVLLLSALVVFVVGNDFLPARTEVVSVSGNFMADTVAQQKLTALIDRSRNLEQRAAAAPVWRDMERSLAGSTVNTTAGTQTGAMRVSPFAEFILFELARVDTQIEDLGEETNPDARALWEQRVKLLQAFLAEMEYRNPERFEEDWSM